MSVEKPDRIDAIGFESSTNSVILTVSDHLDWDDEAAHLRALQAKLNSYLAFVESGEIAQSYPTAAGRPLVIDIVTRVPLSAAGQEFVARARLLVETAGLELRSRVLAV